MSLLRLRPLALITLVLALAGMGWSLARGSAAGAHGPRLPHTVALLGVPPGTIRLSLGPEPAWLPLSDTPETLTLLAGAPRSPAERSENAYIAFIDSGRSCGADPSDAHTAVITVTRPFSATHAASRRDDPFAPQGGASAHSFLTSVDRVVVRQRGSARACVWLATSPQASGRRLVASLTMPLLNDRFGAAVSDLAGGRPGVGGETMVAFDGGQTLRYSATRVNCGTTTRDRATSVAPGTPGTEAIAIPATPCSADVTSFHFTAPGLSTTLRYPIGDALDSPPRTVHTGDCELDALTGAPLAAAEAYVRSVGCRLGQIEVSPAVSTVARGSVSWAAVNGGVAQLAPAGSTVDLVLNGRP